MSDNENIFSEDELNDDQLLNYLKGDLSEKESHAIEESMMNSDFVNDAVEGLQSFDGNKKPAEYVKLLNKNLHAQLAAKKQKKEKRKIKGMEWVIIAVGIILAICFITYAIIIMLKK